MTCLEPDVRDEKLIRAAATTAPSVSAPPTSASMPAAGSAVVATTAPSVSASAPPTSSPAPTPADTSTRDEARAALFMRVSRWVTALSVIACAALVVWGFVTGAFSSVPALRETLAGWGVFAPVGFIVISASQAVFPVLPGGVQVIAAPVLFGPLMGTLYSYIATVIGSFAAFFIGRNLGLAVLRARFKPATLEKYLGWLEHRHFVRWIALAIALPVAPDDLLCYLAGLTPMRRRVFALIIVLLKPWSILAYSFGAITVFQAIFPAWGF